jgi:hypothetical protein
MANSDWVPKDKDLLAFEGGLLPEEEIAAIARWLESCPEAEERLRRLVHDQEDDAVEALRHPGGIAEEISQLADLTSVVTSRILAEPGAAGGATVPSLPTAIRDYQLVRELGKGGMGSVYLARHSRLQRNVALKVLPAHLAADPHFRGRFEREMAIIGQLDHPNLVRAHDAGMEGGFLFLVMELLDGSDLARRVEETGPLPLAEACEAIRQAALALHCAHEHGIVHRDIKPGNLFLTSAGVVKVIDLGLARVQNRDLTVSQVSSIHTVVGTPHYMAPEQWASFSEADRRADIYGLGCTLCFLLTGRPPFAGQIDDSWVSLLNAHQQAPPPSLRDLRADVPAALDRLFQRMLAKDRELRPDSAQEVAEALAPFASRHNLTTLLSAAERPTVRLRPAGRRARQRRRRLLLALVVLLAALPVGLAAWYFTRPTSPPNNNGAAGTDDVQEAQEPVILKPRRPLRGHAFGVTALAFSRNGKLLASGGKDKAILLWDTVTWKPRGPLTGHAGDVIGLAFAPDNKTLASTTDADDTCLVRLWDVGTARQIHALGKPGPGVFAVAYSPDGKTLACGGWDRALHIWDVATRREQPPIPEVATRHVRALSFSPDGRLIATGGSGPTRLWDARSGKEVPTRLPEEMCPIFLPGNKELAGWIFHEGRVALCAVPSGEVRANWQAHPRLIEGLAVSRDGRFLASLGREGIACIWATADRRKVAVLIGHGGSVYAAAFSPDGTYLATAGQDDATIRLWDLPAICHVK